MTRVVVQIVRGQSHGFIQTTEDREVFFHRSDVTGGSFNDLATGAARARLTYERDTDRMTRLRPAAVCRSSRLTRP
jgi:cold shock CspA family protein